jgi:hypothetical protein
LWGRARGIGRRRAISISKTKKIIAVKKNWRDKGIREDTLGSNPHSKGEIFWKSKKDLEETRKATIIRANATRLMIRDMRMINLII